MKHPEAADRLRTRIRPMIQAVHEWCESDLVMRADDLRAIDEAATALEHQPEPITGAEVPVDDGTGNPAE